MNNNKMAFSCYLIAIILIAALAVIYLFTPKLLPYQEAAIGVPWEELPSGFQIQFLSLLRVCGGGYLSTAIALLIMLMIPFQKGDNWARLAMTGLGVPSILIVNYAGLTVWLGTEGKPPLFAGPIIIILLVLGFYLSGTESSNEL